jgi:hypothetical protein
VHANAAARFHGVRELLGKRVQITGVVTRASRGLEMLLKDPTQLKLAPVPNRIPCG